MLQLARRLVLVALMTWAAAPLPAAAQDPSPYLGRTVADVRIDLAGRPVVDPTITGLVESRVGEPLRMRDVRATIDHLTGLGRFADIRVFAAPSDQGVLLRWQLMPIRRITAINVSGNAVLPASDLRREITDRFGTAPAVNRLSDIIATLQVYYADRGFPRAAILPRIIESDAQPERVELQLSVEAGHRVTIASAAVTGTPLEPPAEVVRKLRIEQGRPFDRTEIERRVSGYENDLREQGHYEARVTETHVVSEDGRSVSIRVAVDTGPRVRVEFAGDPVDDAEDLVPIRAERSVDQDLLEDASRAIEQALRERGYRNVQAPYSRQANDDDLVITFTINRGPLHRVHSMDTTGSATLDRTAITPLLQLKPGEPFVDARASAIAAAITELYRVRGFGQAEVSPNIQVLPQQADGESYRPVAVRYDITEGPQTLVGTVTVQGSASNDRDPSAAQLGLAAGRPFYRPQLNVDRDSIERAYRSRGYPNVSVTSELTFAPDRRRVDITWRVTPGDQIMVDRILINGHNRISPELIRRELTLEPGSPMNDDAMLESQRRLAALGLFRRVRITELPRTGSLTRDVLVDIEEADTTTFDVGGGIEVGRIASKDEETGGAVDELDIAPRAFFAVSRRNLWGKNRSITLFGRVTMRRSDEDGNPGTGSYGLDDYRGLFTFREPRAFGTTGDAQFTAFIEQGRRSSFTFNRRGVSADYAKRLSAFTVTGRYTFDYTKLFEESIAPEDQLLIDRLFPQVKLSKLFGALLRDSRDDVLDPQRGAVVGVDGSVAARVLGSEVGFVKTFMQGFVYRRLPFKGVVLAAGARLGLAVGSAEAQPDILEIAAMPLASTTGVVSADPFSAVIRDLPASERFFAGGDTTVRGFALDRLGTEETLDPQGFPQGGNGLAVFNLETRAPYWKNLQFVWFMDAGNVFRRASDIQLDELRVTSGVGVRYRSPIGPLRVDWGWKLSTRLLLTGGREASNVLHISLGQAF